MLRCCRLVRQTRDSSLSPHKPHCSVEGVCIQTHAVLAQAWRLKLKPVRCFLLLPIHPTEQLSVAVAIEQNRSTSYPSSSLTCRSLRSHSQSHRGSQRCCCRPGVGRCSQRSGASTFLFLFLCASLVCSLVYFVESRRILQLLTCLNPTPQHFLRTTATFFLEVAWKDGREHAKLLIVSFVLMSFSVYSRAFRIEQFAELCSKNLGMNKTAALKVLWYVLVSFSLHTKLKRCIAIGESTTTMPRTVAWSKLLLRRLRRHCLCKLHCGNEKQNDQFHHC